MHQAAMERQNTEVAVGEDEDTAAEGFQFVQPTRYDEDGAIFINSLTYNNFRKRLVEHFDIQFGRRRIQWPQRK
jgi:hypothetical protein